MYRILIVEDDAGIAEAVSEQAKMWNFETHSVTNFRNVMAEFAEFDPHLVLMDIGLPFFNGYYWCGEIRKVSRVPVIFISSASDNMNIVMAMNMGGDDFITKPYNTQILVAHIAALLKRSTHVPVSEEVEYKSVIFRPSKGLISYGADSAELTKNEMQILSVLLKNAGKIVSRDEFMDELWQSDEFVDDNTFDQFSFFFRK